MTDRISPTPEDLAISQRNFHRFRRWHHEAGAESMDLAALHRFTRDYLHFGPFGTRAETQARWPSGVVEIPHHGTIINRR